MKTETKRQDREFIAGTYGRFDGAVKYIDPRKQ